MTQYWPGIFIQEAPLLSSLVCSTLVGLIVFIYYQNKNTFSYWEKKGIKGPKPWPFVGNFLHLLIGNAMEREREWARQYGKLYGIYMANKSRLIVADAEILQQICVKDFDTFPNHEVNEFFNEYQKSFLFSLQDNRWKRTRAIMSPTFTSGKIKRMFRFLDACADDLIACFKEQIKLSKHNSSSGGSEINIKDVYNLFTIDAIATCCYGLKLQRIVGSTDLKTMATRNDFVRMAMKIFTFNPLRLFLIMCFPDSLLRLVGFKMSSSEQYDNLAKVVKQLVDQRQNQQSSHQKKYDDYLQLLVDAKLEDELELNDMDLEENHHAGLTRDSLLQDQRILAASQQQHQIPSLIDDKFSASQNNKQQQVLSEIEIVSGAMFLLVVGLETTSSLLTHCTYLLAFHSDVQEKLYEEVSKIVEIKEDGSKHYFSYEALTKCQYLDSVLSETLRCFSSVLLTDRVSNRDYLIDKYKLSIPKGSRVTIAFHAIMNDPEYWPEPEMFNPERFMPGNREKIVPGSYCPFGIGPRHCVGMRFSLTEAKLALAKTIMEFRFEPALGTKNPPDLKLSFGLVNMKRPHVIVSPRY